MVMLISNLQNLSPRFSGGICGFRITNYPILSNGIPIKSATSFFKSSGYCTNSILNGVFVLNVYSSFRMASSSLNFIVSPIDSILYLMVDFHKYSCSQVILQSRVNTETFQIFHIMLNFEIIKWFF